MGNAFEMQECVWECLRSLMGDLNPANALTTLNEVPEELRGHEAMVQVTIEVVEVLGE